MIKAPNLLRNEFVFFRAYLRVTKKDALTNCTR